MTTPRRRLPKHWCEARDDLLMMLSDIGRHQWKILEISNDPQVKELSGKSGMYALRGINLLKGLEFEPIEKPPEQAGVMSAQERIDA